MDTVLRSFTHPLRNVKLRSGWVDDLKTEFILGPNKKGSWSALRAEIMDLNVGPA